MLLSTSPLLVLRRAAYTPAEDAAKLRSEGKNDQVVAWSDGQLVEFVEFHDQETGSILTATLDPNVEGDPQAGASGSARLRLAVEKVAVGGRSSNTRDKHKFRLLAWSPSGNGKSS